MLYKRRLLFNTSLDKDGRGPLALQYLDDLGIAIYLGRLLWYFGEHQGAGRTKVKTEMNTYDFCNSDLVLLSSSTSRYE